MVLRRLACLAACLVSASCANAFNYTDAAGPIRSGSFSDTSIAPVPLKVVTFNIRFGEQVREAAELFATHPDLRDAAVLLLQELDEPGTSAIARRLQMNYLYVPSAIHPRTGREFGVAIVCRCAIDDGHKLPLPGEHALLHLRRAAAAGTLRTAIGGVRVYVVHLETPFGASDETRRRQALAILGDPHPLPPRVIVGGDFNGTDGADELARHQFAWLTRHLHDTAGPFDLDQILVRGLCTVSGPFVVRRPPLGQISDHRPVWTSIQSCPDE